MLSVSNRFSAPMRASNLSKGKVENKSQSVNFSGGNGAKISKEADKQAEKAMKIFGWSCAGIGGLAVFGAIFEAHLLFSSIVREHRERTALQSKVEEIMPITKSFMINHNSDLIASTRGDSCFSKSKQYLQDVIDSTKGKNVAPFEKYGVAQLLKKEDLERQADSIATVYRNQIKKLK